MNNISELNEIYVDALGVDHEDDLDESEEDDEATREAAMTTIEDEAINPNWNIVESDPMITNYWQELNSHAQEDDGRQFFRGQLFNSLGELKCELTEYSVKMRKPYRTKKASPDWYTVVCDRKDSCGCPWRLSARCLDRTVEMWTVVSYSGPHAPNCASDILQLDNRNVTSNFIRGEILGFLRKDPETKPSTILEHLQKRYGICVSYMRAWRAKQKAIAELFGDWEESYTELPRFMAALQATNPGTVVEWWHLDSPNPQEKIFGRVFWAFAPSIAGFAYCRPLISIDGTHLYGKYKHVVLMAMAFDADDHIFPLAFAIVESENGDSWAWFMDCIGRHVTDRVGLCVISDRHAGILKTMAELPRWTAPNAHHRICIRHLKSNVNSMFHDHKVKDMVGWTAHQLTTSGFEKGCHAIQQMNAEAWEYLARIEPEKWSMAKDGGARYGVLTTNLSESFNGVLKGGRSLPLTSLVRQTFYKVNSYFVKRRGEAAERIYLGFPLTDATDKKIGLLLTAGLNAHVVSFDLQNGIFEVILNPRGSQGRRSGRSYTVNLRRRTCTLCSNGRYSNCTWPPLLSANRTPAISNKIYALAWH